MIWQEIQLHHSLFSNDEIFFLAKNLLDGIFNIYLNIIIPISWGQPV